MLSAGYLPLLFLLLSVVILLGIMETLRINIMVLMIFIRGILAPNCFWFGITDKLLSDGSGINLYYSIKAKYGKKIVPVNMLGETINVVISNDYVKQILDNSPDTFAVGKLKFTIFKSFMQYNVGVSEGCPWKARRQLNEKVLASDRLHPYAHQFDQYIKEQIGNNPPMQFSQFESVGLKSAARIVFNDDNIEPFKIFGEANSLKALLFGQHPIKPSTDKQYHQYILEQIRHPRPDCLTYEAVNANMPGCPDSQDFTTELVHQIPHWMFPMSGLIAVSAPRVLTMLLNHEAVLTKLIEEIRSLGPNPTVRQIYDCKYLRYCILETFRLNNPVVTTYRTLRHDYKFGPGYSYKNGSQFLILNNPVLRDPDFFFEPNRYIPQRWEDVSLEDSYYAIMFSQGPQRCPGKEMAIFVLQSFIVNYLYAFNIIQTGKVNIRTKEIDRSNIPQMINPCGIRIYKK